MFNNYFQIFLVHGEGWKKWSQNLVKYQICDFNHFDLCIFYTHTITKVLIFFSKRFLKYKFKYIYYLSSLKYKILVSTYIYKFFKIEIIKSEKIWNGAIWNISSSLIFYDDSLISKSKRRKYEVYINFFLFSAF